MELLRLKERIEIAIQMGESHFREFKSGLQGQVGNKTDRPIKSVCQDISQTLVAFANADGGELLVGVEDDGRITGLNYDDDLVKALLNAPKNFVLSSTPLPTNKAAIVDFDGKKVAYFSISKGTEFVYITSDGKCLKRRDLESIPVSPDSIQFEREEKKSREYDREFLDHANTNDLDLELLGQVAKEFSRTISPEKFLQHLDLAEFDGTRLKLRRATMLLFGKVPQKWHPRLQVRILKIKGTEIKSGKDFNVIKDEEVNNNILKLTESAWDTLRPYLTETKLSSDAIFKTQVIYPELACKEALINAIAHRDYSIEGRGIEIYVFDDRLEIKSPGMLLSSVSIADIEKRSGIHQSRNTYIARVLREIGYMRELGEGFKRIYELMESYDLTPPDLFSGDKSFRVALNQKLVYTTEEKIWLENFEESELTREEKIVVRLGAKGELISPKLIWDTVGIVDTDVYRQIIESLRNKGLLISEVSKPQALVLTRKKRIKDRKSIPRFRIVTPVKENIKPFAAKPVKENIKPIPVIQIKENVNPIHKLVDENQFVDNSDYAKIFVENLSYNCTENELDNLFSKYGEVSSIQIPKSYYTGKGRGIGFIEFEKKSSALAALADKLNIFLNNRKVIVKNYEVERSKNQ